MKIGEILNKRGESLLLEATDPTQLEIEQQALSMAKKYNVPFDIVMRHMWIESGYKLRARSPKNAYGLMQLMPGTAKDLGVDRNKWAQNIEGGVKYLRSLYNTLDNRALSLSGYWKKEGANLGRFGAKGIKDKWEAVAVAYFSGGGGFNQVAARAAKAGYLDENGMIDWKRYSKETGRYKRRVRYARAVHDPDHYRQKQRRRRHSSYKVAVPKELISNIGLKKFGLAPDPKNTKTVIISGNSHGMFMSKFVEQKYEDLGRRTGTHYKIITIHAPQGHGGELPALNSKMENLIPELKGKNVAAVIHIGSNRDPVLEELVDKYQSVSDNVVFIGTPEARKTRYLKPNKAYKPYADRIKWNQELKEKLGDRKGVKFIDTHGLTTQKDLRDNVHLRSKAYKNLYGAINSQITYDPDIDNNQSGSPGGASVVKPLPRDKITPSVGSTPSPGRFVHGFTKKEFPKFDFGKFYKELDNVFIDKGGATGMLSKHGQDYAFGREHKAAWDALQTAKAKTPVSTPAPQIVDADDEAIKKDIDIAAQAAVVEVFKKFKI